MSSMRSPARRDAEGWMSGGVIRSGPCYRRRKRTRFSLADVLPNCLDRVSGGRGRARVCAPVDARRRRCSSTASGAPRSRRTAGHARTLAARLARRPGRSRSVFPTTTAAALATLTTGALPRPARPRRLQRARPRARPGRQPADRLGRRRSTRPTGSACRRSSSRPRRRASRAVAIGPRALPRLRVHRARCCAAPSIARRAPIADRFERGRARRCAAPGPRSSTSTCPNSTSRRTRTGWSRRSWIAALEDARRRASARFVARARPARTACWSPPTTAWSTCPRDAQRHRRRRRCSPGVRHVAGEPRCLQLHLEPGRRRRRRWRSAGARPRAARAWVATRAEAIDAGWFGDVDAEVLPRIGDVLVAARKRVAYYADPDDRGRGMVGQHGSLSPGRDWPCPLLRFGAFAPA